MPWKSVRQSIEVHRSGYLSNIKILSVPSQMKKKMGKKEEKTLKRKECSSNFQVIILRGISSVARLNH